MCVIKKNYTDYIIISQVERIKTIFTLIMQKKKLTIMANQSQYCIKDYKKLLNTKTSLKWTY